MSHRQGQMAVVLVVLVVAAALTACASATSRTAGRPARPAGGPIVDVQNHLGDDMTIYVVNAEGRRSRLATVMRSANATLFIPDDSLNRWGVRLLALPVGPGTPRAFDCTSRPSRLKVLLVLEPARALSTCSTVR